jgi:hypothetical protein
MFLQAETTYFDSTSSIKLQYTLSFWQTPKSDESDVTAIKRQDGWYHVALSTEKGLLQQLSLDSATLGRRLCILIVDV